MEQQHDGDSALYGIAIDPCDLRRTVPIGELADPSSTVESFARETSAGAVGDVSNWDDQAVLAGLKVECAEIRGLDSNYPGRYHRLGTYILESTKRIGGDAVRQTLREEGINRTAAHWAKEIARLYTYEQAVQFKSLRAIVKTLPPKQPRQKKPKENPNGSGDHQTAAAQDSRQVPPPPDTTETILESFIQLGIQVRELFGDEALDDAVEQIKAHAPESFEEAFAEV